MSFEKFDKTHQVINPGDICVWKSELVIYKKPSWGAKGISKGEYGQFITSSGTTSIKYTSVVFAFDPMGTRKNQSVLVKQLVKAFYE